MSSVPRHLRVEQVDDVTVVEFRGAELVEEADLEEIGAELYGLVDRDRRTKLVLNLHRVHTLTSAALAKILNVHKKLCMAGGRLALCRVQPEVMDIFQVMRLTGIIDIYPTVGEALKSF